MGHLASGWDDGAIGGPDEIKPRDFRGGDRGGGAGPPLPGRWPAGEGCPTRGTFSE